LVGWVVERAVLTRHPARFLETRNYRLKAAAELNDWKQFVPSEA